MTTFRSVPLTLTTTALALALSACGTSPTTPDPTPVGTPATSAPAAPAGTGAKAPTQGTPRTKPPVKAAPAPTITEGTWHVGEDVPAGTYRTVDVVSSEGTCYWMKAKDSEGSDIIANGVPTGGHPQVTLVKGQWFTTESCGTWVKR